MHITFLGHACFLLNDGQHRILIDPFLTGNPLAPVSADEVEADYILITHGHGDHVGDAAAIAKRTDATIICSVDLADGLFASSDFNIMVGNIGGTLTTDFGSVKFVNAIHGSGIPGALACGFVIEAGGKKIYHAGDTALTADMTLLVADSLDAALLPIGDVYTMGPQDALRAADMIRPKLVIPMHYNTMPPIAQDGEAFASAVCSMGLQATALQPGNSIVI